MCITVNMGRIDVILPDELEKEFRLAVANNLGMKKGNITIAIEMAIKKILKEWKKTIWCSYSSDGLKILESYILKRT